LAIESLRVAIMEALDQRELTYRYGKPNQIWVDIPKEKANDASEQLARVKLHLLEQGVKIIDEVICFRNRLSFTASHGDRTILILPEFQ